VSDPLSSVNSAAVSPFPPLSMLPGHSVAVSKSATCRHHGTAQDGRVPTPGNALTPPDSSYRMGLPRGNLHRAGRCPEGHIISGHAIPSRPIGRGPAQN
jgi:hypothetical protein